MRVHRLYHARASRASCACFVRITRMPRMRGARAIQIARARTFPLSLVVRIKNERTLDEGKECALGIKVDMYQRIRSFLPLQM